MKKDIVNELNKFLQGEYMGIHAYEHCISHTKDESIRDVLQKIQQDHKLHAAIVAERIQNLGSEAETDVSFKGAIQETFSQIKGFPGDTEAIVEQCLKGENMGIGFLEEYIKLDDIDDESMKMVRNLLDEDREHLTTLRGLLH